MPWKSITAMVVIGTLLAIALFRGIDGIALASGMSLITGLAGYSIGRVRKS